MNTAIVIFALVILLTLAITWWASRRSKSRADYYAAGAKITGVQNGLAIAGDFLSATTFLGMTGMFFGTGVDPTAIYYLCPLVGMSMMMLLVAGPLRRAGKFTLGDVLVARLNEPKMRVFSGVSTIVISLIYLIAQLVGAGALVSVLFKLGFDQSVIIVGALMAIYIVFGVPTFLFMVVALLLILMVFMWIVASSAFDDGDAS